MKLTQDMVQGRVQLIVRLLNRGIILPEPEELLELIYEPLDETLGRTSDTCTVATGTTKLQATRRTTKNRRRGLTQ